MTSETRASEFPQASQPHPGSCLEQAAVCMFVLDSTTLMDCVGSAQVFAPSPGHVHSPAHPQAAEPPPAPCCNVAACLLLTLTKAGAHAPAGCACKMPHVSLALYVALPCYMVGHQG